MQMSLFVAFQLLMGLPVETWHGGYIVAPRVLGPCLAPTGIKRKLHDTEQVVSMGCTYMWFVG
jgi:hypothetical protein